MIFETVVTTVAADGVAHVAPMGVRADGDLRVLQPFKPSTTLSNIIATRAAVINYCTDVRVFAGCVTGRHDWPLVPAEHISGRRLADTLAHDELELADAIDDATRPVLRLRRVHQAIHAPFPGFNRAQAAVIEGAVLVSRLHLLPREKIDTEMAYLQIAIDKTAGPRERQAWDWLREAIAAHAQRAGRGAHA
jgi:hypothetical protein